MTQEKAKEMIGFIQAWAFPILLTVVGVFLYGFYVQQGKIVENTQAISIHLQRVDDRLDNVEEKQKDWQSIFFKQQLTRATAGPDYNHFGEAQKP